jgi:Tol biopolymer transport system component
MDARCFSRAASATLLFIGYAIGAFAQGTAPPVLSELEGTVTFSSDRSGPWRIWAIDANGENLRQITEGDEDVHDVDPAFSPDGETILLSSTRGGTIGIWTIPADGGAMTRVCDGDQAAWSPDGRSIALRKDNAILVRDLDSGIERTISPADWPACSGPSWSPDGKTIAFAARWDAGNAIYLVPAAGGEPVKVYDKKGACEPCFLPDGETMVYETETNICTVKSDGTKSKMITFQAGVQRYGRVNPAGEYIVYCQGISERGPWELYVVRSSGGYPVKLTEGASDMNPDWK